MKTEVTISANKLGKLLSICTKNKLNPTCTIKIQEDESQYKLFTRQQNQTEFVLAAYTKKPLAQQSTAAG